MRTAVDVHNYLVERDIAHEMVPMRGRLRDPDRAAAVLGLEPGQVGRVALLEADGRLVAALVQADRAADPARVAEVVGASSAEDVAPARGTDLTEFLAEAIPPVGLPEATTVVLDESLAEQEVLYFPGGEATSVLKIRAEDLLAATGGSIAAIS